MSNTGNEYEQPGVNYPDRGDAAGAEATPADDEPQRTRTTVVSDEGSDHHGQDGGRETLTVDEAQRAAALGPGATQDMPAMSQNNATDQEKIAGIIAQTRQDVPNEPLERIADVLRQRFADAGLDVPDERVPELAEVVARASSGGAGV